jgi:hypothetical protein
MVLPKDNIAGCNVAVKNLGIAICCGSIEVLFVKVTVFI